MATMDRSPEPVNETFLNDVRRNVENAIAEDVGSGDFIAAVVTERQTVRAH